MNNFLTVFNFEFKQYFKKKSTLVVLGIYFLIALGITFVPALFGENGILKNAFSGEDNSNFQRSAYIIKDNALEFDKAYLKEAKSYTDRTQLENDIRDNKIEEAIVITPTSYEYLTKSSLYSSAISGSEFQSIFDTFLKHRYYAEKGLNYLQVQEVDRSIPQATLVTIGGSGDTQVIAIKTSAVYFLSFLLYMMVLMFGTVTANNVVREKVNRAMELLIVTVKPKMLILGKVLAFAVAAILQIAILVGTFLVGVTINKGNYSELFKLVADVIDGKLLFVWAIFAITGLVMLLFMYSAFSSLASKIEELNTVLTVPMLIFMGAFFSNLYVMQAASNSVVANFLAYFPLTSYFTMVSRYATTDISLTEVGISYALLLATTIIIGWLCVIIYRRATLRYGQKLSVVKLLRGK